MPKAFDPSKYRDTLVKSNADAIATRDKLAEKITGKDGKSGLQAKADKAAEVLKAAKDDVLAAERRVTQTKAFLDAHDNVAGSEPVADVTVAAGRPVADNPQA